jgi:hypothetical protein
LFLLFYKISSIIILFLIVHINFHSFIKKDLFHIPFKSSPTNSLFLDI